MTLGLFRRKMWLLASEWERWKYNHIYGHHIGKGCVISHTALLDKGIKGIHVGEYSRVLRGATILAHDHCRDLVSPPTIGDHCIIGLHAIIMPGVHIGNQVVVGGASVVTKDVPNNVIVVGNPARIVRTCVEVHDGRIINNGQRVNSILENRS